MGTRKKRKKKKASPEGNTSKLPASVRGAFKKIIGPCRPHERKKEYLEMLSTSWLTRSSGDNVLFLHDRISDGCTCTWHEEFTSELAGLFSSAARLYDAQTQAMDTKGVVAVLVRTPSIPARAALTMEMNEPSDTEVSKSA